MHKIKFVFLLIFVWGMSQTFFAQAFSITPVKYTISLAPGESQDLLVTVKNDEDQPQTYNQTILGISQDKNGRPVFGDNIEVAENWVQIKNQPISLSPNEKQDFIFSISVPVNTPPGAHYVGLGIQEGSGQSISAQLATMVILQVSGTATESLDLENFSPVKNIFWNNNWQCLLSIKNTGNIELPLSGKLDIFSFNDKNIYSQDLNFGNKLFAQSNRQIKIETRPNKQMLWPGKYRAMVTMHYGLTNQQLNNVVSFWYLPVWSVCIFFIIILLAIFAVAKFIKHEKVK